MRIGEIKSREELIKFFAHSNFKKGAEIGVNYGLFSEYMHKVIPDLQLLSIDPWFPKYKHSDRAEKQAIKRLSVYPGNKIIKKPSMEVVCNIEEQSLDFVYIDGNHNFDSVMGELIEWSKRVRSGGIVAGHDYIKRLRGLRTAVNYYVHFHKIPLYLTKKQRFGADKYISFYFEKK